MQSKKVMCLTVVIVLMAAFSAFGVNIWQPETVDPDLEEAYWLADPNYWSQGRFPEGSEDIRVDSGIPGILDGEVVIGGRLHFRWDPSTIIVADGGRYIQTDGARNLTDNSQGTIIIEEGGFMSLASALVIGTRAGCEGSMLIMNGGELRLADTEWFDLGRSSDGSDVTAHAYLNEGTLSIWRFAESDASGWFNRDSYMDISFGEFILRQDTDHIDRIERLIDSGGIRAFGGTGTVEYGIDPETGYTVVTGVSPMEPSPRYDELVKGGDIELQWKNLEADGPVIVDVWFGDDPQNLTQVVAGGVDVTSVLVNAPVVTEPTTYYWRVDTDVDGEFIEGALFRFDVTEILPPEISILTPRTISWVGEPIQLETELVHDYPEDVTYSWTAAYANGDPLDEPAEFYPSAADPNPMITVNYHASIFRVTVTVDDGFNEPVSTFLTLDVANNACQAARAIGIGDDYPADIAVDCMHDLEDYAEIVSEWLVDYSLAEPVPMPED